MNKQKRRPNQRGRVKILEEDLRAELEVKKEKLNLMTACHENLIHRTKDRVYTDSDIEELEQIIDSEDGGNDTDTTDSSSEDEGTQSVIPSSRNEPVTVTNRIIDQQLENLTANGTGRAVTGVNINSTANSTLATNVINPTAERVRIIQFLIPIKL